MNARQNGRDRRPPGLPPVDADVSAVVVSYRTGPCLEDGLAAVAGQDGLGELIVVDNGNAPEARAFLNRWREADSRFRLVRPGANIGFAAACNLGAAHAGGRFLAFVNPDLILSDGALSAVRAVLVADPKAWLCGGRLLGMDGIEQRGGRRETLTPWRAFAELVRLDRLWPGHAGLRRLHRHEDGAATGVVDVPTVSGAFMMIAKDRYQALGGMDDNMFLHFEDADLCLRIRRAGGRVLYCGHVPVHHHLSTSDVSPVFVERHKTRSTSYYFRKHFSDDYPSWALSATSVMLWARFALLALAALARGGPGRLRPERRQAGPDQQGRREVGRRQ